ncbi:DUF2269 family protein, partial [Phaeobacter italicus]|uniref:DUF2269 family protein n=1 Tax=Phaeobacter italicus TaxID=481446 RepID=UPI00242CAC2B
MTYEILLFLHVIGATVLLGTGAGIAFFMVISNLNCSVPDDHIDPRRLALFMARSLLREIRDGGT